MTTATTLALIDFHGQPLVSMKDGDLVRVSIRPIAEAMGIDWSAQRKRINRDPILSEAVAIMATASGHGGQDTVTLPLDLLNGWLFGIDSGKVKPEVRDTVIAYQRECYRVLFDYWQGQGASAKPSATTIAAENRAYRELPRLLKQLEQIRHPETRRVLHGLVAQSCTDVGIVPPAEDAIAPPPMATTPDLTIPFFVNLWRLNNLGVAWNHSRDSAHLAVNLGQVGTMFAEAGFPMRIDIRVKDALKAAIDPAFIGVKTVNSAIVGKGVHCWVFTGNLDRLVRPD